MLQKKDKETPLLFRESVYKVAEAVFDRPMRMFHIRLLEKETGLSTTAIVSAVNRLERLRIVKVEKTDLTTNITADIESEAYRFYKTMVNLYRLERLGVVYKLVTLFNLPKSIVLFGSFAKGEDLEGSDIDILVVTPEKKMMVLNQLLAEWERALNRKVNLVILSSLESSEPQFRNAIANGIVLYGYCKVI